MTSILELAIYINESKREVVSIFIYRHTTLVSSDVVSELARKYFGLLV